MNDDSTNLVTEEDTRPLSYRGRSTQCFYCKGILGGPHQDNCIVPQRTVVMEMTLTYVVRMPRSWDTRQIEFRHNESSWCSDSVLHTLAEAVEHGNNCLCSGASFKFVREATEEDHEFLPFDPRDEDAPPPQ